MLCLNGSIEINNCIISDNSATESGGGIYTKDANLTLTNCVLSRNSANGVVNLAGGGGIFTMYGNLTLTNCVFSQNFAYAVGNRAGGGGIFTRDGELILTDCQFNDNEAVNSSGGGIRCTRAELTLAGCTFVSNSSVGEGGGVSTDEDRATLTDCKFNANEARFGGGMCNSHRGATVTNCVFASNSAERGGGICTLDIHAGDLSLNNCTFSDNSADYGGAVCDEKGGNSVLTNCILWGNEAYVEGPEMALLEDKKTASKSTASVSYCCFQGGHQDIHTGPDSTVYWLEGNITLDPYFADPGSGDCHLQSMAGRWDTNSNAWVIDSNHSPCIDTGDPASDWALEIWPNAQRINIGAFGGTAQASKSTPTGGNIADIDSSGSVDETDLWLLREKWLSTEDSLRENLNGDGIVNLRDFAILLDNWGWSE